MMWYGRIGMVHTMTDIPYHFSQSLAGYGIDAYGRKVYGRPGVAGAPDDAKPRVVGCPACGEEFVTFYFRQEYCNDRCRNKWKRHRRKAARRMPLSEDMDTLIATPPPHKFERPTGDTQYVEEGVPAPASAIIGPASAIESLFPAAKKIREDTEKEDAERSKE